MAPAGIPPGIGRVIGQGLGQQFAEATLSTEIIYAFLIIVISLMIYFSTKELYQLTKHKGVKYFRLAFLFFALAFFFRSFIKILLFTTISKEFMIFIKTLLGAGSIFLFMYLSALAIFYLVYSVKYKVWKNHEKTKYIFHIIAAIIALIFVITNNPIIILGIYILLLLLILFVIFTSKHEKKQKHHPLYLIYILLFVFWIFNILDLLVPSVLVGFQLIIYLTSVSIFLTILYKVLKRLGS